MPTVILDLDSSGAIKGLKNFQKESDNTGSSFDKLRSGVEKIGTKLIALGSAAAVAAAGFASFAVKAASDMQEVQGKFDVVFKGMNNQAEQWAIVLQKSYGQSAIESKKYLSSMQDLLKPMGMTTEQAGQMSFEFTKLASDLGSFNNMPTAKVMADLQSATTGEYESMKKYGVVINATVVQQKALEMGLASTKEELTAGMKAQAAYALIMESSKDALGDFARTQGSFANQLKILKATFSDLTVRLGQYLLPIATKIIKAVNTWTKEQGNLDKIIKITINSVRFFYNGIMGLKLAAQGLVAAFSTAFDFIIKGIVAMIKPLDMLLEGFVKLGWIASNPLQELVQFTDDFKRAQQEAFSATLTSVSNVNQSIDDLIMGVDKASTATQTMSQVSTTGMGQVAAAVSETTQKVNEYTNTVSNEMVPSQHEFTQKVNDSVQAASDMVDSLYAIDTAANSSASGISRLTAETQQLTQAAKQLKTASAGLGLSSSGYGTVAPSVYRRDPETGQIYTSIGLGLRPGMTYTGDYTGLMGRENTFASPFSRSAPSVNINVNQQVSRSDVVGIASEMQRVQIRQ